MYLLFLNGCKCGSSNPLGFLGWGKKEPEVVNLSTLLTSTQYLGYKRASYGQGENHVLPSGRLASTCFRWSARPSCACRWIGPGTLSGRWALSEPETEHRWSAQTWYPVAFAGSDASYETGQSKRPAGWGWSLPNSQNQFSVITTLKPQSFNTVPHLPPKQNTQIYTTHRPLGFFQTS